MARTGRGVVGAAIIAFLAAATAQLSANESESVDGHQTGTTTSRIRTADPDIARAIAEAVHLSGTFRRLVEAIEKTDGIVWVSRGRCRGTSACLLIDVVVSGPNRLLRIHVHPRRSGDELMESLGHELQHAVEVLVTSVKSSAALYFFYQSNPGGHRIGGRFETKEAVDAGLAVSREIARARRVPQARQP